jgi:hypothetical protein
MRLRFPNGQELEYETNIAAGFLALGAAEVRPPKPVEHIVRWGLETSSVTGELSIVARCGGCAEIGRFQPRGGGPFIEPPTFRHGSVCPPAVLAHFNSTRVNDWEHEVAVDRAQREKYEREEATRKQRITQGDIARVSQI